MKYLVMLLAMATLVHSAAKVEKSCTLCPKMGLSSFGSGKIAYMDQPNASEMSSFSLLMLIVLLHLIQSAYDGIQPTTAAILTIMMMVHIRLFDFLVTNFGSVGLSPVKLYRHNELYRVFTAPFYHINDYHLIYCMISFAMKARYLEPYLGKGFFFWMVVVFAITINLLLVPISYMTSYILGDWSLINRYSFGMSGVIFAIKVLTSQLVCNPNLRLLTWVELAAINILMPRATAFINIIGTLVGVLSLNILWDQIEYLKCRQREECSRRNS